MEYFPRCRLHTILIIHFVVGILLFSLILLQCSYWQCSGSKTVSIMGVFGTPDSRTDAVTDNIQKRQLPLTGTRIDRNGTRPTDPSIFSRNSGIGNPNMAGYIGNHNMAGCDRMLNISYQKDLDERIERLEKIAIPFLTQFKAPCWCEGVEDTASAYENNLFERFRNRRNNLIKTSFDSMRDLLRRRQAETGLAWRMRCLPYFYVAGSPRCGTTDLFQGLVDHPQIAPWPSKESVYWNRMRYLRPQIIGNLRASDIHSTPVPLQQFLEFYDSAAEKIRSSQLGTITGDISPSYLYDFDAWRHLPENKRLGEARHTAADLIHSVTPMARIIFLLRDPIRRLLSDYNFFSWNGKTRSPRDFHDLASDSIHRYEQCLGSASQTYCLHDRDTNIAMLPLRTRAGIYLPYIKEWTRVFPRSQILVIRFEDYVKYRKDTLKSVVKFLGLSEMPDSWYRAITRRSPVNQSTKFNSQPLVTMSNDTRQLLHKFYHPWNKKLADYMNDERFLWLEK